MGKVNYFRNNKRHRIGLPAEDNGLPYWFFNGSFHKMNGKSYYSYGYSGIYRLHGNYRLHGIIIKLNTSKLVL